MKNKIFRPYEEFSVQVAADQNYIFSVPWLSLQMKVDTDQAQVHETLKAFAAKNFAAVDLNVLSMILLSNTDSVTKFMSRSDLCIRNLFWLASRWICDRARSRFFLVVTDL